MGVCPSLSKEEYTGDFPNFCLAVKSKISGDAEKCLFDYQYNNNEEEQHRISTCKAQVKTNCFLHAMQSDYEDEENTPHENTVHDRVLAFAFSQGKYWVYNGKETPEDYKWETIKDKAWVVVNRVYDTRQNMLMKNNKYKLCDGDIIRFGKIVFRVTIGSNKPKARAQKSGSEKLSDALKIEPKHVDHRRWESTKTVMGHEADDRLESLNKLMNFRQNKAKKNSPDSVSDDGSGSQSGERGSNSPKSSQDGEKVCRICYGEDESENNNPLVEACKCSGSMKLVHTQCVRKWIEEEFTSDFTDQVKSYCWERINCECCHSNFKESVEVNGKTYSIFDKDLPKDSDYIMLESICPDDLRIRYIVSLKPNEKYNEFKIGRARSGDIKINMDSISRQHALIIYQKGEYFLRDEGSTFGTMVLLRNPIGFGYRKRDGICIQSGPTLFEIQYDCEKKIETTYVNKDGKEKKCAAYPNFKHKLPAQMRNYIDKHSEPIEVIDAGNQGERPKRKSKSGIQDSTKRILLKEESKVGDSECDNRDSRFLNNNDVNKAVQSTFKRTSENLNVPTDRVDGNERKHMAENPVMDSPADNNYEEDMDSCSEEGDESYSSNDRSDLDESVEESKSLSPAPVIKIESDNFSECSDSFVEEKQDIIDQDYRKRARKSEVDKAWDENMKTNMNIPAIAQ